MTENAGTDSLSERERREAALAETIEQSFSASDRPSSDPNPDSHSAAWVIATLVGSACSSAVHPDSCLPCADAPRDRWPGRHVIL